METFGFLREEDRLPEGVAAPGGALDVAPLLGTWFATDHHATGVLRITLSRRDGALVIRTFGADSTGSQDWGETAATVYGATVTATEAMAFTAAYDFGFLHTILAAYAKQGILVLDTFNTFADASGRSNYFSREFFYRPSGGAGG
ncbi:hypothetical protein [Amycolatopsis anabasis]|uniref:hypothetical protein n=1 Tax=Amycolatopsis anabasis TaxID=1840409 RepID=UPI00131C553F|nr:hypothetical protein [Amycolatopsis anabasis]